MTLDDWRERRLSCLVRIIRIDGVICDGCRVFLGDLAIIILMQVPH